MRMRIVVGLTVCFSSLALTSCDENPGRVHAKRQQLIGVYETKFDRGGAERLELKNDGTYVQEFSWTQGSFRHVGKWVYDNHILGGTDVDLVDAVVSEDEGTNPQRIGTRILNVHMRSGKLALALNEVADWYYERIP